MIEETLRNIGLSRNEIKIYLALLELGPSLMGQICGKTKIHRRNVYDSIEMLKDKGFISSTIINNRNKFEAIDPNRIIDILDEKKINFQKIMDNFPKQSKGSAVRVYTGQNGRKIIFEDKLKFKETQYVINAHEPSQRSSNFIENYHLRRISKRIPLKMLFISPDVDFAKRITKYKFVQAKILPDSFTSPIAINIYGNKVAFLLGSGTSEPISILIEDINLSKEFRAYFSMLWKMARKLNTTKKI
ncbi:hypothetical protein HYW75_06675 [Candidatus Pacearchaeota archaeon]|nr:hypothetical protein [Candidatus Pacearchaeota archaeon]